MPLEALTLGRILRYLELGLGLGEQAAVVLRARLGLNDLAPRLLQLSLTCDRPELLASKSLRKAPDLLLGGCTSHRERM